MSRFRVATNADVDAIVGMMRTYYAEDDYAFSEQASRANLSTFIAHEHLGRLWVAEVDGVVAGYMAVTLGFSFEYGGTDAFIDEIVIGEQFRRRGLGREAMDVALDYCRRAGVKALHLEVESHRTSALRLYEQAGFEHHNRHLMTKMV